jgi:adenosylcobyric acid synthase
LLRSTEIRHGKTEPLPLQSSQIAVSSVLPDDAGFQCRGILALYTHGLFENAGVLRALFGAQVPSLDDTFEGLADFVDRYLGAEPLSALLRP